MTLQHPEYLWGLLLLVPVAAVLIRNYFSARSGLARLYGGQLPVRFATIFYVKAFFSGIFFLVGLFLLIIGVTGVSWGSRPVDDVREGLEVVFVVDVSHSMRAEDVSPNRLRRGIELMRGVITGIPDARFGAVAFKGEGSVIIPVTENRYVFDTIDRSLTPDSITAPWSDLLAGLEAGAEAFPEQSSRNQILVLVSDGENQGGSPVGYASELGRRGIPVVTVVLGSAEGATIPMGDDGTPLRDSRDQVVVSQADSGLMQRVAEGSGGVHIQADAPGALGTLLEYLEQGREGPGFRLVEVPRDRGFILAGLLLLMIGELIRIIRWKGGF